MFPACLRTLLFCATVASALDSGQNQIQYTAVFGGEAHIASVAVGVDGSAYVGGWANAALPTTAGAFQSEYKPGSCASLLGPGSRPFPCPVAFVAKLTPDGTALSFLTYLGSSNSIVNKIAVDAQGNAWIAGTTSSPDLPVSAGAFQSQFKGRSDAFAMKLNSSGSKVLFATYLGGSTGATGAGVAAIDGSGNFYLTGTTDSADLPTTPGAFQGDTGQIVSGYSTDFVTKFDGAGRLLYSTFFHGASASGTYITSIAVDSAGNAYLTGSHIGGSLPTTQGAFQTTAGGQDAAFVAKLDPNGSKLIYSTYLAANSQVFGNGIAVDAEGNAYVIGNGLINIPHLATNFPVTQGAFQTTLPDSAIQAGNTFAFLTKLNPTGSGLAYSTLLSASDMTGLGNILVDSSGSVLLSGGTYALDFPTTAGALWQCNPNGAWGGMGFVLKLAADGSHPLYSTYMPADVASVALSASGELFIAGNGIGSLPIVPGSFGWKASGAFAAKLDLTSLPRGSVSCVVSAASRGGRAIAPGEIVDIIGIGIGPDETVVAPSGSMQIDTTLAASAFYSEESRRRFFGPVRTGLEQSSRLKRVQTWASISSPYKL